MQTFDMALFDLYEAGSITYEDALRSADSMNELRLRIKLEGKDSSKRDFSDGKLSILNDEEADAMMAGLGRDELGGRASRHGDGLGLIADDGKD